MARIIGTIDIDFDISCNVTPELYRKILKGMQREVASLNSGIDDIFYDCAPLSYLWRLFCCPTYKLYHVWTDIDSTFSIYK